MYPVCCILYNKDSVNIFNLIIDFLFNTFLSIYNYDTSLLALLKNEQFPRI